MNDAKRPLWPWILGLLIGLPVLYIASFGPACWLEDRALVPLGSVKSAHKPVVFVLRYCPNSVCIAMYNYGMLWSKEKSGAARVILIERLRYLDDRSRVIEKF
jgi:hypothetical protein